MNLNDNEVKVEHAAEGTQAAASTGSRRFAATLRLRLTILLSAVTIVAGLAAALLARGAATGVLDAALAEKTSRTARSVGEWRFGVERDASLLASLLSTGTGIAGGRNVGNLRRFTSSPGSLPDDYDVLVADPEGTILADRRNTYGTGNNLPGVLVTKLHDAAWRVVQPLGSPTEPWGFLVLEAPLAQALSIGSRSDNVQAGIVSPEGLLFGGAAMPPPMTPADIPVNELSTRRSADGTRWVFYRSPVNREAGTDEAWDVLAFTGCGTLHSPIWGLYLGVAVTVLVALVGVYFGLPYLLRSVDVMLRQLRAVISGLRSGDFSVRVGDESGKASDILQLAREVNGLAAVLETAVRDVEFSAQLVASSAEEILSSAEAQEETANSQSSSLNQTAATAEEMNLSAQQAAQRAEQVVLRTEEASQQILALSENAQQISRVTEFIDEISHQIRILALNASIESAKAGGKGGGFSVIASEIRRLADDTRGSTSEIEALVQDMQEATSTSVMTMEQTVESVKVIGRAMHEQSTATGHVTDAMADMSMSMNQTVESTGSTVQAGLELNKLAFQLQQAINRLSGREVEEYDDYQTQYGQQGTAQDTMFGSYEEPYSQGPFAETGVADGFDNQQEYPGS